MKAFGQLDYGEMKVGKTDYLVSVFNSEYVKPERILYIDNHGSTNGFDVPLYSPTSKHGVWHLGGHESGKVLEKFAEIRGLCVRGKAPYDLIVIDDLSEWASQDVAAAMEKGGASWKAWGVHLDNMTAAFRYVLPKYTGIILLCAARAGRMRDLLEDPKADDADTIIRPLLQGQFGSWALHEFDIISWHQMEVTKARKMTFTQDFFPHPDRYSGTRFMKEWIKSGISPTMVDPTFDKVYDIVDKVMKV